MHRQEDTTAAVWEEIAQWLSAYRACHPDDERTDLAILLSETYQNAAEAAPEKKDTTQ